MLDQPDMSGKTRVGPENTQLHLTYDVFYG